MRLIIKGLIALIATSLLACAANTPGFEQGAQNQPYLGSIPTDFENTLTDEDLFERIDSVVNAHSVNFGLFATPTQTLPQSASDLRQCDGLNLLVGQFLSEEKSFQLDASEFSLTEGDSCDQVVAANDLQFSGLTKSSQMLLNVVASSGWAGTCANLTTYSSENTRAGRSFEFSVNVGNKGDIAEYIDEVNGHVWVGGNDTHIAAKLTIYLNKEVENHMTTYKIQSTIWADHDGNVDVDRIEDVVVNQNETLSVRTLTTTEMQFVASSISAEEKTSIAKWDNTGKVFDREHVVKLHRDDDTALAEYQLTGEASSEAILLKHQDDATCKVGLQ